MLLLPSGRQVSGKQCRVAIGGTVLTESKWSAQREVEENDTVNFESFSAIPPVGFAANTGTVPTGTCFAEGIGGVESCKWSFGGDWDASLTYFGSDPPGLYPRDDLAALSFFLNKIVKINASFAFPFARVRSANAGAETKGKITFEAAGSNQGTFLVPIISF